MYSNAHLTAMIAAAGITTAVSGWAVAGYVLAGAALLASGLMTVVKLRPWRN